jgi:ribonuclease HII
MAKSMPDLSFEREAFARGAASVAGVDEAGRGPRAGPVIAAAVRLRPQALPEGLNDSKQLTARHRARLFDLLSAAAEIGIGEASVEEIDRLNILRASHLAMRRALEALRPAPDLALIDGNSLPAELPCPARPIVRGDTLSLSIAAASIVAKVTRDRIMKELARDFPGYGWERNAGYPTREHLAALKRLGPSPHHRRSFRPVHNILCEVQSLSR